MPFKNNIFKVGTMDGRSFVLLEPVSYVDGTGKEWIIPAGQESDGASTPRELWQFLPPFGDYWRATFLHDFLYRMTDLPKDDCDYLLLEAMESIGVFKIQRDMIFKGVRDFGQFSFDMDRRKINPTT